MAQSHNQTISTCSSHGGQGNNADADVLECSCTTDGSGDGNHTLKKMKNDKRDPTHAIARTNSPYEAPSAMELSVWARELSAMSLNPLFFFSRSYSVKSIYITVGHFGRKEGEGAFDRLFSTPHPSCFAALHISRKHKRGIYILPSYTITHQEPS